MPSPTKRLRQFTPLLLLTAGLLATARADSVVVFNEVHYHPADAADPEWIELHNQMAVNVDLSGWSLRGGVDYTFPPGTVIVAGGYFVVNPPWTGSLANEGERLRLFNNANRCMDEIDYGDGGAWPVGPDGSGATLAKIDPGTASAPPENWRSSRETGGTPGAENFPAVAAAGGVALRLNEFAGTNDAEFRIEIENIGTKTIDAAGFVLAARGTVIGDHVLPAPSPVPPRGFLVVTGTALGFRPADGDRLFFYGPAMTGLVDAARADDLPRARSPAHGGRFLVPSAPTFGSPNVFTIEENVVINEIMYHFRDDPGRPGVPAQFGSVTLIPIDAVWRYDESGADAGVGWATSNHPQWSQGPALLGSETTPAALPEPLRTEFAPSAENSIVTYYVEHEFSLDAAQLTNLVSLSLRHVIDDGAVFYLNGAEVLRFNMQDGPVIASTLADPGVPNAVYEGPFDLPVNRLVAGTNRLSVEVHQQVANSSDVIFGAELTATIQTSPAIPARPVIERDEEWVELFNKGAGTIDLSGWSIAGGIAFDIPAGTTLPPGGFLVVARNAGALATKYPALSAILLGDSSGALGNRHDTVRIEDAVGNPVDEVTYHDGGRWPALADGGGSSLERRDPDASSADGFTWAASDESGKSAWQTITYRGTGGQSYGLSNWNEFRLGLLEAGEVLIDDIRVVRDPDGAAQSLIQNGDFTNGTNKWRLLGNHRHSAAISEPGNPGNMVLLLDASGSTDTRHNHLETTFTGNTPIQAAQTYEVSLRARWLSGSNLLNTRCFYQRLARTVQLDRPELCGTPGAPNSRRENNIGPTITGLRHEPVVPAAAQTITVHANVSDPDGLGPLVLKSRVNEGPINSTAFQVDADGNGTGTIAGQSAGAVIQFWIEASDALGAVAMAPQAGPDSRALIQIADSQGTSLRVPEVRLVMLPGDRAFMLAPLNVMSNERLGCTVIYRRREIFYDAEVRLRGSGAGRARDGAAYQGFNISLPSDQRFRGVHDSLSIDRSGRTPAVRQQHEIFIKHMFNHAGLPCMADELIYLVGPSATYTGTAQMMMAAYGDHFTETQLPGNGQGGVFNLDITYDPVTTLDGNPESLKPPTPFQHIGTDFTNLGDSADDYRAPFEIRTGRGRDDYSALIRLCKTMALPAARLDAEIGTVMDVDQWMRYSALMILCGIGDTFVSGGLRHNIRIYDPGDGSPIMALPWDMDFVFNAAATSSMLPMTGNLRRIVDIPRYRRLYWGHVHDLVQTTFATAYMNPWLAHYGAVVGQSFTSQSGYISARRSSALSQLPPPVTFAITTNGGADFTTSDAQTTIEGQGWINVRRLRLAGVAEPIQTTWLDADSWRVTLPLASGQNPIALEAYDFQDRLIGTAGLVVTSTTTTPRPLDHLRVTEIHYHPANPATPAELAASPSDEDFEFIELRNTGSQPLALDGVNFDEGVDLTMPPGSVLAGGEFAVVVRNRTAFTARYGPTPRILGEYLTDALANGGESLTLRDATGFVIQSVTWDDGWFPATDGPGWSMVALHETAAPIADGATGWAISWQKHGNPGAPNGPHFSTEFEGWRHQNFSAEDFADPSVSGLDAGQGGLSNLLRYALGLTPASPAGEGLPAAAFLGGAGELTFRRQRGALDLLYLPESSPDLIDWTPYTAAPASITDNGDGTESVTVRFPSNETRFMRLRVSLTGH